MFKKLLTLTAAAALCFGANADVVEDYFIDYAVSGWHFYVMGYTPEVIDGVLTSSAPYYTYKTVSDVPADELANYEGCEIISVNGNDTYVVPQDEPAGWYQYFIADGIPTEPGKSYTVTVMARAEEETQIHINMGWGWGDGQQVGAELPLTTEWAEQEIVLEDIGGSSCNLVAQITFPGKVEYKWLRVTHNEKASQTEWINLITNGGADEEFDQSIAYNSPENVTVCAWGREDKGDPHPAFVEDGAFVVHATAMTENPWDNQFWIMSPQSWNADDQFRLSFRCKATKAATASTQAHSDPSVYLHYEMIGNVNFTTDWTEVSKSITVGSSQNGMKSIAFNLNEFEEANDYYFDDIKWEIAKLDEGFFIAGDFNDVDYGSALEFVYNAEEEAMEAIIGTAELPAYEKIIISTRRGTDSAFASNAILVDPTLIVDGEWMNYSPEKGKKFTLPEPGIWQVLLDPSAEAICFTNVAAGIEDITTDNNAPSVYYNLQGVRIENPVKGGVYIVKKGNQVTKIIR